MGTSPCAVNEDDRHINLCRRELSLEVKAASPAQPYIEHQACRSLRAPGLQEFLYRVQRPDLQTHRLQQASKRLSDIWIVIDDDDTRLWLGHRSARSNKTTATNGAPVLASLKRSLFVRCAFLTLPARRGCLA
jgi:hypothetical protein